MAPSHLTPTADTNWAGRHGPHIGLPRLSAQGEGPSGQPVRHLLSSPPVLTTCLTTTRSNGGLLGPIDGVADSQASDGFRQRGQRTLQASRHPAGWECSGH